MGFLTKGNKAGHGGLERARHIPPTDVTSSGGLQLLINKAANNRVYLSWTPSPCILRASPGGVADRQVVLRNADTTTGGQLVFRAAYGDAPQDSLTLTLRGDGSDLNFFIAGKPGFPSTNDQDGKLSVQDAATNTVLLEQPLMVRIRKNANTLSTGERDRFLAAYAAFNARTADYQVFLDDHNLQANPEIHGRPSFLVWHRVFVLDIERRLQEIDPSVCMPYWRFDQPAPNLSQDDLLGGHPDPVTGRVTFAGSNPMRNWTVNGNTGVVRRPGFNTDTGNPSLRDETATLALGSGYEQFRTMEGDPHGSAHVSFNLGPINNIGTATQDPIFFMLHCNVDRLWAKWQWTNNRFEPSDNNSFSSNGSTGFGDAPGDTLWPWDGDASLHKPPTSPGGPLPQLNFAAMPSPHPKVEEAIDYIGKTEGHTHYVSFDDVPFV